VNANTLNACHVFPAVINVIFLFLPRVRFLARRVSTRAPLHLRYADRKGNVNLAIISAGAGLIDFTIVAVFRPRAFISVVKLHSELRFVKLLRRGYRIIKILRKIIARRFSRTNLRASIARASFANILSKRSKVKVSRIWQSPCSRDITLISFAAAVASQFFYPLVRERSDTRARGSEMEIARHNAGTRRISSIMNAPFH